MKIYYNPEEREIDKILRRPINIASQPLRSAVRDILNQVHVEGDRALISLTSKFDKINLNTFKIDKNLIADAEKIAGVMDQNLVQAIDQAIENVRSFHQAQVKTRYRLENAEGGVLECREVAISRIGLYIPQGLISSLIMLGVPAKLSGSPSIVVFTPPDSKSDNYLSLPFRYVLARLGLEEVYTIGGAQAIAAMAYGTETVAAVDKICGPGNSYVNEAKFQVFLEGVGIDLPAGPSEVLVIGDEKADPRFIAADLLSQAEHGPDSQVILLTTSSELAQGVLENIGIQLEKLGRREIAVSALDKSSIIVLKTIDECINISNKYAPEHLILNYKNCENDIDKIISAGSVFIGQYTPEVLGDYASGTNHVLPTNGAARFSGGVGVSTFTKKITFQTFSKESFLKIASTVKHLAEAEGLSAHKNAISIREND